MDEHDNISRQNRSVFLLGTLFLLGLELLELRNRRTRRSSPEPAESDLHRTPHCRDYLRAGKRRVLCGPESNGTPQLTDCCRRVRQPYPGIFRLDHATRRRPFRFRWTQWCYLCLFAPPLCRRSLRPHALLLHHDQRPLLQSHALSHIPRKFLPSSLTLSPLVQSFVTLYYTFVPDIYDLINYTAFSEALFVTLCVAALLWLRFKRPDMERPIRVPTALPILFLLICVFLVLFPIYASPFETGMSLLITLSGIPLYFATAHWKSKPRLYKQAIGKFVG